MRKIRQGPPARGQFLVLEPSTNGQPYTLKMAH
jgi:hypothetical protein